MAEVSVAWPMPETLIRGGLGGQDNGRSPIRDGGAIVESERIRDHLAFEIVVSCNLLPKLGIGVERTIVMILDSHLSEDLSQSLRRELILLAIFLGHHGRQGGHGGSISPLGSIDDFGEDSGRLRRGQMGHLFSGKDQDIFQMAGGHGIKSRLKDSGSC